MNMKNYTVSVIIPAYNAEAHLAEAIESTLHQTFKNFEIIIIDDGSTDNTFNIAKSYTRHNNVIVIRQLNFGPSKARNLGIKSARGEYCAFLDSDDLMLSNRLELQVKKMQENPGTGLVYTDLMTFNERGVVHSTKKVFVRPFCGQVLDKLLRENFITTSTVMVRRECFDSVGYFDENMKHSEDYKMWLNIAGKYCVKYIDIPLVKYRYQSGSLSSNRIVISTSSYNVVKEFWEKNHQYRNENHLALRASLGRHLMCMADAHYHHGNIREALRCLIKSFFFYPFAAKNYKLLVKLSLCMLSLKRSDKMIKKQSLT
jgi:glycosyltransferase involved in cell wall biosynthesis